MVKAVLFQWFCLGSDVLAWVSCATFFLLVVGRISENDPLLDRGCLNCNVGFKSDQERCEITLSACLSSCNSTL